MKVQEKVFWAQNLSTSYSYDGHSSLHHCCPSSHFLHHRSNAHECKKWYSCRELKRVKAAAVNNFVTLESKHRYIHIINVTKSSLSSNYSQILVHKLKTVAFQTFSAYI